MVVYRGFGATAAQLTELVGAIEQVDDPHWLESLSEILCVGHSMRSVMPRKPKVDHV